MLPAAEPTNREAQEFLTRPPERVWRFARSVWFGGWKHAAPVRIPRMRISRVATAAPSSIISAIVKLFHKIIVFLTLVADACAVDDLPRRAPGEAMDFEPGLSLTVPFPREPIAGLPRLEATLAGAKRGAAEGERLFRAGVIAKVESEKRALKVVRIQSDLASARAETAASDLAEKRAQFEKGGISQEALDAAQAALDSATAASAEAAAEWRRAELVAAELNLSRHRKLLAAGVGSRAMVTRAQSQLAALKDKAAPAVPRKSE